HDRVLLRKRVLESALRQTTVQGHLSAFESPSPLVASPGLLPLVALSRRFSQLRAHAPPDAHLPVPRPARRLQIRECRFHLALYLHQVPHLVNHSPHRRRVFPLHRLVHSPESQPPDRRPHPFLAADRAAHPLDLYRRIFFLARHRRPPFARLAPFQLIAPICGARRTNIFCAELTANSSLHSVGPALARRFFAVGLPQHLGYLRPIFQVQQRVEGRLHHVVLVRRAQRLRQHVLNSRHLHHRSHRASRDHARSFRRRLQQHLPRSVTSQHLVRDARALQIQLHHVLLRLLDRFPDRHGHFAGFAHSEPRVSVLVPHHHQRREA